MKFKVDQHVTYKGRRWVIYAAHVKKYGETTYYLRRGVYRTTAKESEVSG